MPEVMNSTGISLYIGIRSVPVVFSCPIVSTTWYIIPAQWTKSNFSSCICICKSCSFWIDSIHLKIHFSASWSVRTVTLRNSKSGAGAATLHIWLEIFCTGGLVSTLTFLLSSQTSIWLVCVVHWPAPSDVLIKSACGMHPFQQY